jgi:phosphate starvation-inducible PhoH-like protein
MEHPLIIVPAAIPMVALTGPQDSYLRIFENTFPGLLITCRGNEIFVKGDGKEIAQFEVLVKELLVLIRAGQSLSLDAIHHAIGMVKHEPADHPAEVLSLNILSNRGKTIRPKTANQKRYVEAIDQNTITFGVGPAGTGKTYLAMAKAIQALQAK